MGTENTKSCQTVLFFLARSWCQSAMESLLHVSTLSLRQGSRNCVRSGSVATSRGLAELLILDGDAGLCGEDGELLGEGRIWIEGESRLSFAHHVNHFDAG
jgi:hypothetical protein